jgi:outer membrane protein assembly factor BamB
VVLMRPWTVGQGEARTTAIAIANGVRRWERPGNVVSVTGSSALLAVRPVPSQTGANRRVEGPITALDPLTGSTRWSVPVPSSAVLLSVPGPAESGARMLLVRDDRTMVLHDLDTGERLAETTIPPADYDPDNPAVAGGLILLRHPGPAGMEITSYDPVSLRALWTEPAYDAYLVKECGALACLLGPRGIRAVDPANGDERWNRPRWRDIDALGTMWIAYGGADSTDPIGIVDPGTGTVRVALTGWRPVGPGGGDHLLVTRSIAAGARTMVAVARPGEQQPHLLTELPAGTGDCQAVPTRLVCRSMYGELVVWAYREG